LAGACAAGKLFWGVCASADETTPTLNTVAAVVPIKRLNVIDADSTWCARALQPSKRDHPDCCDL
jgi:hypothetical protein